MKTNALLTYLLYALLAGLICVAGYKACQMKKEEARLAQESKDEAFQKQMRDMGYLGEDTSGTQYVDDNTTNQPVSTSPSATDNTAVTSDGIEDEAPVSTTPAEKSQPAVTTPAGTTVKGSDNAPTDGVRNLENEGSRDKRFRVVAGSFANQNFARRHMQKLIIKRYVSESDAEIGTFYGKKGTHYAVIVKRTNSLSEANRIVDRLERKGIDANVIDRNRKQ